VKKPRGVNKTSASSFNGLSSKTFSKKLRLPSRKKAGLIYSSVRLDVPLIASGMETFAQPVPIFLFLVHQFVAEKAVIQS
jgi:hypothetical protein